jgi:hypothetical protein
MGGPAAVIGECLARRLRGEFIAKPLEHPPQVSLREHEEQHHCVGLLGHLVAVWIVAFGTQDAI